MEKLYHQRPTQACATPAPSRSQPASSAESFRRGSSPPHFSRTYFAKMRTLRESPYTSQRGTHRVSSSRFSLCQVLQRLLSRLIACRFLDALLPNAVVFFGEIVPPLSDSNSCHTGVLTLPTSQLGQIVRSRQPAVAFLANVLRENAYSPRVALHVTNLHSTTGTRARRRLHASNQPARPLRVLACSLGGSIACVASRRPGATRYGDFSSILFTVR